MAKVYEYYPNVIQSSNKCASRGGTCVFRLEMYVADKAYLQEWLIMMEILMKMYKFQKLIFQGAENDYVLDMDKNHLNWDRLCNLVCKMTLCRNIDKA